MVFYHYSYKYCPDTGRSAGSYMIFYQGGPIDHVTHVPGPFSQSSSESEYNTVFTSGIYFAHFRILIHELLNKSSYIVP